MTLRVPWWCVPVCAGGGYLAALLSPGVIDRVRSSVSAATKAIIQPNDSPEPKPTVQEVLDQISENEQAQLRELRHELERDQAIENLAYQLVMNESLEAQLRETEEARDSFKKLAEQVIGFSLSRPPLVLQSAVPAVPKGTEAGSSSPEITPPENASPQP